MRPMARAYSHHGHGPRAEQTGRIHISVFRDPAQISLANSSRSMHRVTRSTASLVPCEVSVSRWCDVAIVGRQVTAFAGISGVGRDFLAIWDSRRAEEQT